MNCYFCRIPRLGRTTGCMIINIYFILLIRLLINLRLFINKINYSDECLTSNWRSFLHKVIVFEKCVRLFRDVNGARFTRRLHFVGQRDVVRPKGVNIIFSGVNSIKSPKFTNSLAAFC